MSDTSHEKAQAAPPARWSLLKRILVIGVPAVVLVALALGLGLGLGLKHKNSSSAPAPSASPSANVSALAVGTTWDYALGWHMAPGDANATTHFYSVDLQNTPQGDIAALIGAGHTVVCYFSAGSVEAYRPDAGDFPATAVGNVMVGWPDEKWVDIRDAGVRQVMTQRIALAQTKGCQGIDADNINGYANDSGFNLTQADAVDYVRFLAGAARAAGGMMYGLKNGGDIVEQVVDVAAFDIQESCAQFNECALYAPFIQAGKPVFHVEYTDSEDATSVNSTFRSEACGANGQQGFSTIIKHLNLDEWTVRCD